MVQGAKMKKRIIAAAIAAAFSASVYAQNLGFEDGTSTGWSGNGISAVGTQTLQAGSNQWTVNPYGSYMGKLTITSGTFSQMTNALNLTSTSASGIQTTLSSQAQSTGNGQGNPTTASWASKTVTLTAGQTFTLAWQYISTDYVPFNDGSIATLVKVGDPTVTAVLNNYTSQYALLGFTNPGTGDYSTGSYGATGWQTATYTVTESGDYLLGFGVFNLDDQALSPVLYVDEIVGTTLKNGQTFGAVAPNPGTSAPDTSGGGSVTPPPPPGPTLVSNVTGTTGSDTLASGNITVNGGTIQIMMTGATLTQLFDVQSGAMTVDQNSNTATMSGVISGAGDVVIANSGTGGSVTFTAVNTYTGATTINQGATLINDGSITSSSGITNLGTFTNNGTAGAVVNGFNGDGNTAVTNNNGTVGTVTNWSTFNNNTSATTGTVTNFGTFENAGTTGTFNNAGVLNNNTGGVVNELGYNNHWVSNSGTINNITYNGGTVLNNAGGTIGTINNTEAHGTFHNEGTVTGNVTTNSTFNNYSTGIVQGTYTNNGTLNNAGTVGAVTNDGAFNNAGTAGAVTLVSGTFTNTGTAASVNNTASLAFTNGGTITGQLANAGTVTNDGNIGSVNNTGTFNNNGTVGDVTNAGTMTTGGTAGVITNSGTLTQTGGTASVNNTGTFTLSGGALGAYTQTAPGVTNMTHGTPVIVTNNAQLGGGLTVNNAPTAYGKYTLLSAGSVNGAYDSFTSAGINDYLKYSGSDVKLYVTPPAGATQSSIDSVTGSLGNAINLQSGIATNGLGNDCSVFGDSGSCVSVNLGKTAAAGGDLVTGGITVGKRINDNWKFGVFTNNPMNSTTVGSIETKPNAAYGGYVGWNKNTDGTGLGITASAAQGNGSMKITRNGPEVGVGNTTTDTKAYQVRATYAIPVDESVTVTPYVGVRRTETNVAGYTETGPAFPLTVNSTSKVSTDAIAGVTVGKKFNDKLSGSITAGVTQRLSGSEGKVSGTSEIGGLSAFNSAIPGNGKTNTALSAGLGYNIDKTTKVGVNLGWQQRGANADVTSIGISITKGF